MQKCLFLMRQAFDAALAAPDHIGGHDRRPPVRDRIDV